MTLRELLDGVDGAVVTGDADVAVRDLVLDSRQVAPGDVFFALAGQHADGARFVASARAAGAVAVVAARGAAAGGGTLVEVAEPRLALAQAADRLHRSPSRDLKLAAVTGTNGKTTTTYLLEAVFVAAGWRAGRIGTTGIQIASEARASAFTTPEAPQLQALLAEMRERAVVAVAMEASSHALSQRRTYGLACDVAIFTNLTQDHLDFHHTMADYLDAKLMLFDGRNGGAGKRATAVVNADDPAAAAVIAAAERGDMRVVTFGQSPDAHVRLGEVRADASGIRFELTTSAGALALALPMLGRFNAWNAAAAFAAARALGLEPALVRAAFLTFAGVPGRLERVAGAQSFTVAVDYAHTPDALERALEACREHARGRVLCVFGCGGDRDRGKRPLMGALAARLADRAWVTNDNPRSEDPATIAAEIVAGAPAGTLTVTLDRRDAIAAALGAAAANDVVLIAGKGHETTQTLGTQVLPFDDRVVAREWLAARGGS